ncbi:diguanylate cyclase (GGDEF)-like protein [Ruminiclostridium sufflavum DSM 19573]|uniref:Diguanylate cyclase (GGDEF)-like protein n=1 Tax=Ruminiclostridium sufflavum DSM 19573 TaxID=1121337 RepID=A0A318XWE4_9FIRM|nr:diguanylate cyclase [Ruminiclostridium sufflavum]PYG87117.1 diguanylate cyclase (GGDEF)-like protein [Ruminiclostridium sufflavum DSM 19573]
MPTNQTKYDKWRKVLIVNCLIISCVAMLSEIAIVFYYYKAGMAFLPLPLFLFRFLVLPGTVNFAAVIAGKYIIYSPKYKENTKNYTAILVLCVLCACMECVHYVFPAIMCSFCVPVFFSILFQNKKMTSLVQRLGYIFLIFSAVISKVEGGKKLSYLIFDCLVAAIILFCSYIVSIILIKYEEQRTEDVRSCYKKQMELNEQLKHDLLTGLYNYNAFLEILKLKRNSSCFPIQLAVIDLDNFKYINDTFGHIQGNEVLVYISFLLKKYTSNIGYPARYGGEEFVVLFPETSIEDAFDIVEKIRKDFSEHHFDFSKGIKFTFSCGLAENDGEIITPQKFFDNADRAMYLAKKSGKNKTIISQKHYKYINNQ